MEKSDDNEITPEHVDELTKHLDALEQKAKDFNIVGPGFSGKYPYFMYNPLDES